MLKVREVRKEDPQYLSKSNEIKLMKVKWKFVDLQTSRTRKWESGCGNDGGEDGISYSPIRCSSLAKTV